jgi:hypothetical protein
VPRLLHPRLSHPPPLASASLAAGRASRHTTSSLHPILH